LLIDWVGLEFLGRVGLLAFESAATVLVVVLVVLFWMVLLLNVVLHE
jgi:hypothetical protein